MYLVASVHLFVRLSKQSCLNRLTFDLDFQYAWGNVDLGQAGIVGQGRSRMLKIVFRHHCLLPLPCFKVKGQGQMFCMQQSILGAWLAECRKGNCPKLSSKAGSLPVRCFLAKRGHYQSDEFFCVSVTRGICGQSRGCGQSAFNY